jgi:hypothetical protein
MRYVLASLMLCGCSIVNDPAPVILPKCAEIYASPVQDLSQSDQSSVDLYHAIHDCMCNKTQCTDASLPTDCDADTVDQELIQRLRTECPTFVATCQSEITACLEDF